MPALKVSSDQRAELRSQAHALKPVVLIGAEGLTDAVLTEIKVHLGAHQLIKIRVFGDEREERLAIYDDICDKLNAAPIQHIGKLLVIWKPEAAQTSRAQRQTRLRCQAPAKRLKKRSRVKVARRAWLRWSSLPRSPCASRSRKKVVVRGNERVTAGGNIKRAKKRQASAKRSHQSVK